jgi:hypothetical protein
MRARQNADDLPPLAFRSVPPRLIVPYLIVPLALGAAMMRDRGGQGGVGETKAEVTADLEVAAAREFLMTDNNIEIESSAIAAFTLAQFSFWALIESGVISTDKAADMLAQGIGAHSKGDLANQKAAQMLQTILDMVQRDQRPPAN